MITDINLLDPNKTYTYADYLTWQFQDKLELLKGKIFKMSPVPSTNHQRISGLLHGHFFNFFEPHPYIFLQRPLMFAYWIRKIDIRPRDLYRCTTEFMRDLR